MILTDYYSYDDKASILSQLDLLRSKWEAIPLLYSLLKEDKFHETLGNGTLMLLLDDEKLTDGKPTIAAFSTFADIDEVDSPLKPWIGFVFTDPDYRGRHLMGQIIESCMKKAATDYPESDYVYISTAETGLYEKYGFEFFQDMTSRWNGQTRGYRRKIER
jgi:predicted acetyltransferase